MKATSRVGRLLPILLIPIVWQVVVACSDDETPPAAETPDAGPDVKKIEQDTGAPDTGATGTLGAECNTDGNCVSGLTCWRGDSKYQPAKGVCTSTCTDDAKCEGFSKGASCSVLTESKGYCLEGCNPQRPLLGTITSALNDTICHGRKDMGCHASPIPTKTNGYCLPTCNDDSACASGTKCDLGLGMCSATAKGSIAEIGAVDGGCASSLTAASASGATTVTYCSAVCTIGVTPSCGWTGPTTKANAVCNLVEGTTTFSAGNQGKCSRLCDCDSDCDAPLRCHTLKAEFAKDLGRAGSCLAGDTNIVVCGDGGVVDAGDAGIVDAADGG